MSLECLEYFAKLIENEIGIIYSNSNYFQLQNRLEDICSYYNIAGLDELHKKAKDGMDVNFKQLVIDTATNNETLFFRDAVAFQSIKKIILPALFENFSDQKIEIWSAACSSGQEPYSVAMLINELETMSNKKLSVGISASDISAKILHKAKSGIYTQLEVQRGLSTACLLKYFTQQENNMWALSDEVRSRVHFFELNLRNSFCFSQKFHFILCRNILIYQKPEAKIQIINKISRCLKPGGFLILGAGESLLGLNTDFEQLLQGGVSFYRLKSGANAAA